MTPVSLLAMLPMVLIASIVTLNLTQTSLLTENRFRRRGQIVIVFAAIGLFALTYINIGYAGIEGFTPLAGPRMLDIGGDELRQAPSVLPDGLRPAFLVVALLALCVSTLTDLRERSILEPVFSVPTAILVLFTLISLPLTGRPTAILFVLVGVLLCGGLGLGMALLGKVVARHRGAPPDVELMEAQEAQSDLRISDFAVPLLAATIVALVSGYAGATGSVPLLVVAGALLIALLPVAHRPRRYLTDGPAFARLLALRPSRTKTPEADTDTEREAPATEDFGTGDILLMIVIGILLGPVGGLLAILTGTILNGLISIPLVAIGIVRGTSGTMHIPMVPSLAAGVAFVFAFGLT